MAAMAVAQETLDQLRTAGLTDVDPEIADLLGQEIERQAIDRAKSLFGADHANVQPHAGAQTNMAVYMAALKPGDTILSLELSHGGHLTHGLKVNFSGRLYTIVHYGVSRETNVVDYDDVLRLAKEHRPRLIVCGGSAYPRTVEADRFREIADEVDALLL